jgi:hypothetical protein
MKRAGATVSRPARSQCSYGRRRRSRRRKQNEEGIKKGHENASQGQLWEFKGFAFCICIARTY